MFFIDLNPLEDAVDGIFQRESPGERAALVELDGQLFFVCIIFRFHLYMRVAGFVEPFVEEVVEVPAADCFHDLFEVLATGILIPIGGIICRDASPEELVSDRAAKHVEYPAAFFIAVGIQELHVIVFYTCVDDGRHAFFLEGDELFTIAGHTFLQGVDTIFIFQVTMGHIGSEAFAKPEVSPLGLCGGVAEPLVGYLVRHQGFNTRGIDRVLKVEDSAGIFQAAETGFRLNITAFFEGIGSDVLNIEGKDLQCVCITFETDLFIFPEDIIIYGDAHCIAGMIYGKVSDSDDHYFGGEGNGLFPMGQLFIARQLFFFL